MTQRPLVSDATAWSGPSSEALPPPDVVNFIRYCHRRRGATWPELYDEMCAVAARREFNGWDRSELEARGLTFSLLEMQRLAGWSRAVLARMPEPAPADEHSGAGTPRLAAPAAVA